MTNRGVKRVLSAGGCARVCVVGWGPVCSSSLNFIGWLAAGSAEEDVGGGATGPTDRSLFLEDLPKLRPYNGPVCVRANTASSAYKWGDGQGAGGRSPRISSISAGRPIGKQHIKLPSCLQPLYGAIFGPSLSMLLNETLQSSGWWRMSEPTEPCQVLEKVHSSGAFLILNLGWCRISLVP